MNRVKLKEVVEYSKDRISSDKLNIDTYITTDNLLQNKQGVVRIGKLPTSENNSPKYSNGNILVSNIRPYLKKIYYAKTDGGVSADVLTFKVKTGFDSKYIYYCLFQDIFFDHMMAGSKGTKMPRGDKNQILDFEINIPNLPTQQKIAAVLSALDDKIELNNKINTELEAMAKTLYDYWFVQFEFPNSEGKPYKSSGGAMEYNPILKREIPKGWEVKRLEELGNFKNGVNYDPSKPGKISCPIINVRNISNSTYFLKNEDLDVIYLNENDVKKYSVNDNSIIIARSGIPGATRLINDFRENTLYCGFAIHYCIYNANIRNIVFFLLKSLEDNIKNGSGGTIMKNVNQGVLNDLQIALPHESILNCFNEKIELIFEKIKNLTKQTQELAQLHDWLLPMLMNGQVKVEDTYSSTEQQSNIAAEAATAYQN